MSQVRADADLRPSIDPPPYEQLFVGGQWVAPSGPHVFHVVCPGDETVLGTVPAAGRADVDQAVAVGRRAFDEGPWPRMTPDERVERLRPVLAALREQRDPLAQLLTAEVGVPVSACGATQVDQPIATLDYYLALGLEFPFTEQRTVGRTSMVFREPVGVVAAVVPWNAPLRSVMNKLAPALVAGCSVIVKPAQENALHTALLSAALQQGGIPDGVVSILPADRDVAAYLVGHPGIDKVAFTGSTAAGRSIMAACAANLTRVGLELGGKSAAIVLDDADHGTTVRRLLPNIVGNNGQACTAQSRVLVSRRRHDELVEVLTAAFAAQRVGDPFDPRTQVGPLISARQRERVLGFVDAARHDGARVATGGGRPHGLDRGWYVEPTVLVDVDNRMRIAQEEVFGPVAVVIAYDDLDHAVALANDSAYGLAGSVWTADLDRGMEVAGRVRTGTFSVNGALQAVDAPFGGYKSSGLGREYGPEGLESFLEKKAVAARPL